MSISQLQQAIEFIEGHILEDINYVDAAKSANMSGYSFHRVFSFTVGMTPNEYIRARRLSLAAQELQSGRLSVLHAALKYGYESPESFSKAFSKFHGSTPRQAMYKGARLRLFEPLVIKISIGGGTIMEYRMEHKERQRFMAVRQAFSNETSLDENGRSIPEFWVACREKGLIAALLDLCLPGQRDLYGLCSPLGENSFYYGIGVKLEEPSPAEPGPGCMVWETEPVDYAVFRCCGPDGECLGETWEKFFKEFSPQTGYRQADATDYEVYFETSQPGLFCELWVPVTRDE